MGNQDKKNVQGDINTEKNRALDQSNQGITDSQNRSSQLTPRTDTEHNAVYGGYSDLAGDPNQGITQDRRDALLGTVSKDYGSGGGGGGGGGGDSRVTGNPLQSATGDYRDVYADLIKNPFDQARLGKINSAQDQLLNTSGNYGDVNKSITGLQDFAKTGGVTGEDFNNINRGSLQDIENTGGYSEADRGNLRARGNSAIAATYGNLQDNLNRQKLAGNNIGPGWSAAGFKLARQGAQDIGVNARNTEADIADRVVANRLAAGGKLSDANLALQGLKNTATLSGYQNAGNLGLGRQSQIDSATAASAGIGLNTQGLQNQTRLGGASALGNDQLSRMQMLSNEGIAGASRGAAMAMAKMSLDAENNRFLIGEGDQNRLAGLGGMNSVYKSGSGENDAANNLLYNYRGQAGNQQGNLINSQIANNASNRTDWANIAGSGLSGLGLASRFFPMGGGNNGQNPGGDVGGLDAGGFPIQNPGNYGYGGVPGPTNPNHE